MRFVIGCALSLIFSANCAAAMAPAKDAPKKGRSQASAKAASQESLATIDYSKIVTREIQRELKEQASAPKSAIAKPLEITASAPRAAPERRKAVVLPSHRSFKATDESAKAVRGEIRTVELPPSDVAREDGKPGSLPGIY
jgi:hypothetical protein